MDVAPFRVAMRGTERAPPRCSQLHGVVGEQVFCAIHPVRPTPCREFGASWEQGVVEPRCDEARARHGLPPLTEGDWAPGRPRTPGRRRAA